MESTNPARVFSAAFVVSPLLTVVKVCADLVKHKRFQQVSTRLRGAEIVDKQRAFCYNNLKHQSGPLDAPSHKSEVACYLFSQVEPRGQEIVLTCA